MVSPQGGPTTGCDRRGLTYLPTGLQMCQCVPLPEPPPPWASESSKEGLRLLIRTGAVMADCLGATLTVM